MASRVKDIPTLLGEKFGLFRVNLILALQRSRDDWYWKQFLHNKKMRWLKKAQAIQPNEHLELGSDLAAAKFVCRSGGKVQDERGIWVNRNKDLPSAYMKSFKVMSIDASNTSLTTEGTDNFAGLEHLKSLNISRNRYLDDFACDQIAREFRHSKSLEEIDLSHNEQVSIHGLNVLLRIPSLKCIRALHTGAAKYESKDLFVISAEDEKDCKVLVNEDLDSSKKMISQIEGGPDRDAPVYLTHLKVPASKPDYDATIAVINMNDPKTKNALSKDSVFKMLDILHKIQNDGLIGDGNNKIRALIFRSNVPGVFCAGANLKERLTMSRKQVEAWLRIQRSLMDNINDFPYPTIAAIDGHALGGGLELALACDIRIVNEGARVGLVETRLAIIPGAGGTQRLARLIGIGKAKEHIFVAEPVSGTESFRLGIANHLTTGEDSAFKKAIELAEKISKRGPIALRLAKAAIDNGSQTSLDTGLDIEHAYYGQLLDSSDRAEGMKAFVEKREPVYTGQ